MGAFPRMIWVLLCSVTFSFRGLGVTAQSSGAGVPKPTPHKVELEAEQGRGSPPAPSETPTFSTGAAAYSPFSSAFWSSAWDKMVPKWVGAPATATGAAAPNSGSGGTPSAVLVEISEFFSAALWQDSGCSPS